MGACPGAGFFLWVILLPCSGRRNQAWIIRVRPRMAPDGARIGPWNVATGEAQAMRSEPGAQPVGKSDKRMPCPEGVEESARGRMVDCSGATNSFAPAGAMLIYGMLSTGCARLRTASLHPWLQPGAPLGRRNPSRCSIHSTIQVNKKRPTGKEKSPGFDQGSGSATTLLL